MPVLNGDDLLKHWGHTLAVAAMINSPNDPGVVAVFCTDCEDALIEYEVSYEVAMDATIQAEEWWALPKTEDKS